MKSFNRHDYTALLKAFIPSTRDFQAGDVAPFYSNFLNFFNDIEAGSKSRILLLNRFLKILSALRYLRPYPSLKPVKSESFLRSLNHNAPGRIRAGISGIRSLVIMSYYSHDNSWGTINYGGPLVDRPE